MEHYGGPCVDCFACPPSPRTLGRQLQPSTAVHPKQLHIAKTARCRVPRSLFHPNPLNPVRATWNLTDSSGAATLLREIWVIGRAGYLGPWKLLNLCGDICWRYQEKWAIHVPLFRCAAFLGHDMGCIHHPALRPWSLLASTRLGSDKTDAMSTGDRIDKYLLIFMLRFFINLQ